MAASLKQRAKDRGEECFYLFRKAWKSVSGLVWRSGRGAGSHRQRWGTMTQFPTVYSERTFQFKKDTVSPGTHLTGSRPARISKNVPFPLLETQGSTSFPGRGAQKCNAIRHGALIESKKSRKTAN